MKYMGSKTSMLANGLGDSIRKEGERSARIVDLFAGSAAISWYAAEHLPKPVLAVDLQEYACVFARAVLGRTRPIDVERLEAVWLEPAARDRELSDIWRRGEINGHLTSRHVSYTRRLCDASGDAGLIVRAYGGHYFSARQAHTIDVLVRRLPVREPDRSACLAALLGAASRCAASPGHTAQPFSPTRTALPFIHALWRRDVLEVTRDVLRDICARKANVRGEARRSEAVALSRRLRESDLVVVDPPYSAVQYSRFYHVLEAIAQYESFDAEGVGRYPPLSQRPQSAFSLKSAAARSLTELLVNLEAVGCTVIVTFPAGECSNGLSGDEIAARSQEMFDVESQRVYGRFSTMGGNNAHRPARLKSDELILVLRPRRY